MPANDYPVDVRVAYPERSSRGWAALTIFLIKFLALLPHAVILVFLGIAQFFVAFAAQFVVAFRGEYPPAMFRFVEGVLRWTTRVSAFVLSLTDRYPPFSLRPDEAYPVDLVIERPPRHSRTYAAFTVLVQLLFFAGVVLLLWWLWTGPFFEWISSLGGSWSTSSSNVTFDGPGENLNVQSFGGVGLLLRQIAALPHFIVLAFIGIAAFLIWFVVQWVILFGAVFPRGMHDVVAGYVRWYSRVSAYSLGLVDRYPPFTLEPSLTAPAPPAVTWPLAPPPAPASASWPPVPPPRP